LFEELVIVFGIPEIEREVNPGAGRIFQELSLPEVRIALEKLNPRPLGAIDLFKTRFVSPLDFELP
jgi:hypothetical protein